MGIRLNARRSANHRTRCARRNSRRSCRQGVTHLLGRHDKILSRHKRARISTSGSNRDKSLWGHYCGKSATMRIHASNQSSRPPTTSSLASVCVDSNSTRVTEARVEKARSTILFAKQGVVIVFNTYTHTLKYTNHPRCQSCLRVLRKSDTMVARVHSKYKISPRWKNGVEVVQLKCLRKQ